MDKIILTEEMIEISNDLIVRKRFSMNGESDIFIYEPTNYDIDEIKQIMGEKGSYQFSTNEIFEALIHRFTNIDVDKIPETVKYKLIDSPPLWFRRVCAEIQLIISEIVALQSAETKELINRVENMSDFVSLMRGVSPEAIEKVKNIDTEELKNALENLTEEQKLQINQMLKDLKK